MTTPSPCRATASSEVVLLQRWTTRRSGASLSSHRSCSRSASSPRKGSTRKSTAPRPPASWWRPRRRRRPAGRAGAPPAPSRGGGPGASPGRPHGGTGRRPAGRRPSPARARGGAGAAPGARAAAGEWPGADGGEPRRRAQRRVARVHVAGQGQHVVLHPAGQLGQLLARRRLAPALRTALEEGEPQLLLQRGHAARHGVAVHAIRLAARAWLPVRTSSRKKRR